MYVCVCKYVSEAPLTGIALMWDVNIYIFIISSHTLQGTFYISTVQNIVLGCEHVNNLFRH